MSTKTSYYSLHRQTKLDMTVGRGITISQLKIFTFSAIIAVYLFIITFLWIQVCCKLTTLVSWFATYIFKISCKCVCWGILFLFIALSIVKALSHIAVKTTQSEDNRKLLWLMMWSKHKASREKKRLRFVE